MMELELEITGSLLLLGTPSMLIYLLGLALLKWKKVISKSPARRKSEISIVSTLIGLLSLAGAFESFSNFPALAIAYIFLLIFTGRIAYLDFRKNQKKFPFGILMVSLGIMFIAMNDSFEEEFFLTTFLIYMAISFLLIIRWIFKQIRIIIQLKDEKAKTELLHLKSQVNPHFFFNMLNNLYGLVNKDSKKAQALILKLSDMMRYSIYEGQKEVVTLEEEIEYLQNYIELHQMRYHKKIDVEFDRDIQQEDCKVMPLLFIILLENAFKHGVENLRKDAYVYLDITTTESEIQFRIENNFDKTEVSESTGIGLKNLKRRLELVYPNQHTLAFFETENVYKVELTLQLL